MSDVKNAAPRTIGNLRLSTMVEWLRLEEQERSGSCRWWIGSSTKISIVNKQAATVESLIDGHRVKNVISWNSWSLSLRFFCWNDQWRRVSFLYGEYESTNLNFPHWEYEPFSLNNFDSSEATAELRVNKEDIPLLVNALQVPEYFRCSQGTGKAVRGGRGSDPVNLTISNKQINN